MSETARELMEQVKEWTTDQITGESDSVTALTGAPHAALNVSTSIYNPPSREAVGGARSQASITIERDDDQERLYRWLRSYKEVRQQFEDNHVERAREFRKSSPAMGIIAARQVLEIPHRGKINMLFMWSDGVWLKDVAEAFGRKYDSDTAYELVRSVFSVSEKIKKEMHAIISKSREAIGSLAVQSWQEAIGGYQEIGDAHATGMSYAELAKIYGADSDEHRDDALRNLSGAVRVMVDELDTYPLYPPVENVIEVDQLTHHLTYAVRSVTVFDDGLKSKEVDLAKLKQAVYRLDDYGVSRKHIAGAYRYLAKKTPLGSGKLFFGREVKEIEAGVRTRDLLDRQGIVFNPRFRKHRRHKRP